MLNLQHPFTLHKKVLQIVKMLTQAHRKCHSAFISEKKKKMCVYMHRFLLQFAVEINTRGRKTATTFFLFLHKLCMDKLSINKDLIFVWFLS